MPEVSGAEQYHGSSDGPDDLPPRRKGGRVSFPQAMAAQRQAFARAARLRLTTKDYRTLGAVVSLTTSYARLEDSRVYIDALVELSGLDRRDVRRCLRTLDGLGVIVWKPSEGRRSGSTLGLPAAADRGAVAPPGDEATGGRKRPSQGGGSAPPTREVPSFFERDSSSARDIEDVPGIVRELAVRLARASGNARPNRTTLREIAAAWRESPEGVEAVIDRALAEGEKPEAFALTLLRAGEHRENNPGSDGGPGEGLRASDQEAYWLQQARAYVEAGWPTGVRRIRTLQAESFRPHVLGRDRAPYDVPGGQRPTLREIALALQALDEAQRTATVPVEVEKVETAAAVVVPAPVVYLNPDSPFQPPERVRQQLAGVREREPSAQVAVVGSAEERDQALPTITPVIRPTSR